MPSRQAYIDLPGNISWPIDHREEVLLWGWDRGLWSHLAKSDPIALAKILRKRLRARAFAERAQAERRNGIDGVAILQHLHMASLYEAAAEGWRRVADRLIQTNGPQSVPVLALT